MSIATDGASYSQEHIQKFQDEILGPAKKLNVWFYNHATRDHQKEREQQKRIDEGSDEVARPFFRELPYITKQFQGDVDMISKPASQQDMRQFPEAWEAFQTRMKTGEKHSLSLLPGFTPIVSAVCDELGLTKIEDMLVHVEDHPELLDIFPEIEQIYATAERWVEFFKPNLKIVEADNG